MKKSAIKISIMKAMAFLLLVALFGFSQEAAQTYKYGGSSFVHVKDTKGNTRVVYSVTNCVWDTEAEAKSKLQPQKYSNEEFDSQIYYSIDRHDRNDRKRYGGSSSARVRNSKGETRVVTSTTSCVWDNPAEAKGKMIPSKYSDEEFITGIAFDIDSCN